MGEKLGLWRRTSFGGNQAILDVLLMAPPFPVLPPPPFPRYALASHFFWGLWSILQASMSTIEFGYLVITHTLGMLGGGRGGALVVSSRKSRQPLVAAGRRQQV